jgi:serine phosphatase RsbU (regulator of sigma subunit)
MLSHASADRPRTRPPRRLGAALALTCCALASFSVTAATARSGRARPTVAPPPTAPLPVETGAAHEPVPSPSTGTSGSPVPGSEGPSQVASPQEGGGQGSAIASEEAGAAAASRSRPGRKRANPGERGRSNPGSGKSTEGQGGGSKSGEGQEGAGTPKEVQGGGTKPKQVQGGDTQLPQSAPPAPVASAAAVSSVLPPVVPAPAAATPATPLVISGAPEPTTAARGRLAAGRRGRTGAAAGALATAALAASGSPLSGTVDAVGTPTPPTPARPSSHGRPARASQSPLVTVTKIVDVVPAAIRILIGALVALGLALAIRSRLIAVRARRLEGQRQELLEDVGLLQGALLPVLPPRLGPVSTSAAYRPAAGPGAGGDFYDVFALEDGQIAVIVGDISGHGRSALPHTALVRFTLRAYLESGMSPREALQRAAAVLERQLGDFFATAVAATYHPRERTLTYACAGHPPPVVIGSRQLTPVTACSSPPIGAGLPTGMRQTVVSVPGGSLVCFYTDGVVESRVGPELFGQARLAHTLGELEPRDTASALLDRVTEQSDERPDDMAACLLRIDGGAAAPTIEVEELELDRREAAGRRAERFLSACGVEDGEAAEIMHSARVATDRAGKVLIEVRNGDGPPEVALRRDNVAFLHVAREIASAP